MQRKKEKEKKQNIKILGFQFKVAISICTTNYTPVKIAHYSTDSPKKHKSNFNCILVPNKS